MPNKTIKMLKIIMDGRRDAYKQILKTSEESNIDVIVVQDPNKTSMQKNQHWLKDKRCDTSALTRNRNCGVETHELGEPQPAEKWEGILDATVNTKACYQMNNTYNTNISAMETEDCLYLNVYTPRYPSANLSLPVMFFIYGGGFIKGASAIDFGGPHYLMESDVIVVGVNYRVGPFGFLSTGDTVIPGNYGLKDQQMGLRWVRDNIQYFGGDPEKVTIFGQSAGGASVTFHLLNKQSEGLFRAAIAESGTFLNPWSYQRDHKEYAYKLATTIDGNFNKNSSTQELLEFLRSAPAAKIKTAAESFKEDVRNYQDFQGFFFTPVVEPEHETAFFTENPYEAIEKGRMNRVPLMMGFCSEEFLSFVRDNRKTFEDGLKETDEDITLLVNKNMHLKDEKQLKAAGEAIRNIYTNGSLYENEGDAVRHYSDSVSTRGLIRHAELQSKFSDVYFYQFSYSGKLGGNNGPFFEGAETVGHGEDENYIWVWSNWTLLNNYPKEDKLTSDRYRALYTNFAKYLNPTPTKLELFDNVIWPTVKPDDFQYLNINKTLTIERNPKADVYSKWVDIYETMAVKPYDTF
ncbi:hypothetical protein JTB14_012554 [Gonioctena quinquepunctata]|nr:hypothetical protein JTB14_012554 [Gonioctena quinquepunctata]